jgi:hypothetical protein
MNKRVMHKVDSSNVSAVGFDPGKGDEGVLAVEFKNGTTYLYHHVPRSLFEELRTAESVGKFFGAHVRDKFKTEKEPRGHE